MQISIDEQSELQSVLSLWRGGAPHEDDFRAFWRMCNAGALTLLDCGANAGQTAASFLMGCPHGRVISFEPNPLYQPVLAGLREELGAERFDFFMEGLSDRDEAADLHVPVVDDKPYLQEASLDLCQFDKPWVLERLRSYGQNIRYEALTVWFVTADSRNLDVDAVKIDAEGSELRVLSGMLETIFRCEPIFLIENNDFHHVTQFLCRLGYRCYRWENAIDKLVPMYGTSANSFYLLDNHCEQFESLLVGPEHLALSEQMATAMDECDEAADFKNH